MSDCGLDGLTFKLPSRCKPQFAADCDLHTIVERFMKTGQLPQSPNRQPIEGDFTQVDDFQQIQDRCAALRQQFDQLPLEVRNQFNNDPVAWFEHMSQPEPESKPEPEPKPEPKPELKPEPKQEPKQEVKTE